jgi:hypothetical protein
MPKAKAKVQAKAKPRRVIWIRMGDADDYHKCNDIDKVVSHLREHGVRGVLRCTDMGVTDGHTFSGLNYISLYWGDYKDAGKPGMELADHELREINEILVPSTPPAEMEEAAAPFEVPNLDDLTIDPEELKRVAVVLGTLSNYATHKAQAMRYRSAGDIITALRWERDCQAIYEKLPKWARW